MSNDKITLAHPAIQGDLDRARRVIEARRDARFMRRTLPGIAAAVVLLAAGFWAGHARGVEETSTPAAYSFETSTFNGHPELDTADYGTDLPHCASDDWNSTHLPRCYTQRVTDGAVIIIDQEDNVLATLTEENR